MPLADKVQEAAAKYIAEIVLTLVSSALLAVAVFADEMLPPQAFELLGRYATGRIVLGLFLTLLVLIAWVIYLHPSMVFDRRIGAYYQPRTKLYYCTKCRVERRLKVPLRVRDDGWRCEVCGRYYKNPDYKEPPPQPRKGGRDGWMRI